MTQSTFNAHAKPELIFGKSPEGLLLGELSAIFRQNNTPSYKDKLSQFIHDNSDAYKKHLSQERPLYHIAALRIAYDLGAQEDDIRELSQRIITSKNKNLWEIYGDGIEKLQKACRVSWCHGLKKPFPLIDKMRLSAGCLFQGNDPYAINAILGIGLNSIYRKEAQDIAAAAVKRYPDDKYVATAHLKLNTDKTQHEILKTLYMNRFPEDRFLKTATFIPLNEEPRRERKQTRLPSFLRA